jgi:thiol-disulfide isomerase/thioredoxin
VSPRLLFSSVAVLAVAAGSALWWATRDASVPPAPETGSQIAPGALLAASFADTRGVSHALGEFQGKILVLNFWATWCVPCREEMPAFARLQERWRDEGVQFVGLADDDPAKVDRFGRELAINYPLWVGGETVGELSRRLGNRLGVLPHTVIIDRSGQQVEGRVGPYTEEALGLKLRLITGKSN